MLNEQCGFVRKVHCDPKKQSALPVSTLRPGSYPLIFKQEWSFKVVPWWLYDDYDEKLNLLKLAAAILETIWCEEWSAMAPVELRWFFLSFCHLGVFFFSFFLAIDIIVSIIIISIIVTLMTRCEGFTSGDPAETKGWPRAGAAQGRLSSSTLSTSSTTWSSSSWSSTLPNTGCFF